MTKEAYKEHLKIIENQIRQLTGERILLREQFLKENAEFSIGDKVVLVFNANDVFGRKIPEHRLEVFVSGIDDRYFKGSVNYRFNKVKKDGTMSSQSAGIYRGWNSIEKATIKEEA